MKTIIWVYLGDLKIGSFRSDSNATIDDIICRANEKYGSDHWSTFRIDNDEV